MRDWAYLITAPNQPLAEMWRDLLIQNGIAAMLQPEDTASYYGVSGQPVRVMVARGQVEDARVLLAGWEDGGAEGASDPTLGNPGRQGAGDGG